MNLSNLISETTNLPDSTLVRVSYFNQDYSKNSVNIKEFQKLSFHQDGDYIGMPQWDGGKDVTLKDLRSFSLEKNILIDVDDGFSFSEPDSFFIKEGVLVFCFK